MISKKNTGKIYRIVARGELGDLCACALGGMRMESEVGRTVLTGELKDQTHLVGAHDHINGLGLEHLSINALPKMLARASIGIGNRSLAMAHGVATA
jgi:hypothetical protein